MIEIPGVVGDVVRSVGLSTAMRAAGVVTGLLPIPQPTLLVGPGSSRRLGQAIAGFGHRKILIVTDGSRRSWACSDGLTDALDRGRRALRRLRRSHAGCADPADRKGHDVLPERALRRDRGVRRRLGDGRGEDHRAGGRQQETAASIWSATSRACTSRCPSTPCRRPPAPGPRSPSRRWCRTRRPARSW